MNECLHICFISKVKPKKVEEVLLDSDLILAMQAKLNPKRNKV